MPGPKNCRRGAQRHHKHRVGRMVVPHGHVSGVLFTINPRQESKALRELQLYLHPLIADLEKTFEAASKSSELGAEDKNKEAEEVKSGVAPSTSSLLAAELAAYVSHSAGQRNTSHVLHKEENSEIQGDDNDNDNDNDDEEDDDDNNNNNNVNDRAAITTSTSSRKRPRVDESVKRTEREHTSHVQRWLAPLETGCKGYLMLSIPFPRHMQTKASQRTEESFEEEMEMGCHADVQGKTGEGRETTPSGIDAHSIIVNPLVHTVVDRIFRDIEENPRPLLRNCFRLLPCEVTCCPTLPEMRLALERLLEVHFPVDTKKENHQLHRVGFSFKVKNNTNVEGKKAYLHAALESFFPVNRFVVVPAGLMKNSCGDGVEAMFCAFVAHATCVMGVQQKYSRRGEYNLHAIGAKHLELSNSV